MASLCFSTNNGIVFVPDHHKSGHRLDFMKSPIIAIDARLISSQNTGDTSYWRGLIWGLSQLDPHPNITLFGDQPNQSKLPDNQEIEEPTPFHQQNFKALSSRLWSYHDFPKMAKAMGANVIHTQYNVSPHAGKAAITTIHDISFLINPDWYGFKDRVILTRFIPASVRRASKILTVSQTSKNEIENYIPDSQGKVTVTPNAIGHDFVPSPKKDAWIALSKDHNLDKPFVFTITSQWARKNTQLAAQAFQQSNLAQTHKLVTCGPGEPLTSDSLHFGYVDDLTIRNLYAAADCFVLPSLHEGFGIPILEAFASQTPVICGTGGAIPEVAGDAAIICPDYNPATWANALNHLFDDSGKLEAMIKRGQSRVQDFSWIKTAELTMQAYEEVANG